MKVIACRTLNPERMLGIVESIIDSVCAVVMDPYWQACACQGDGPCTCAGRHEVTATNHEGFAYSPDSYGKWIGISFRKPDIFILDSTDSQGTLQELIFNLKTGQIIYNYDGRHAYNSYDLIWDHLPKEWQELNHVEDWNLLQTETNKPQWGVKLPLLQGQFGTGPCNQEEYMSMQNELALKKLRFVCKAVGVALPADIIHDERDGFVNQNTWERWTPKFTGVHYRRAAANGVTLSF